MPRLLTPLPAVAFPHELDRLTIEANTTTWVTIEVDDLPLLDVSLTPAGGRIELHSLFTLLADALQPIGLRTAPCVVSLDGAPCARLTLYPCRMRLNQTATDVLPRYFLTPAFDRVRSFAMSAPIQLAWAAMDDPAQPLQVTTLWSERGTNHVQTTVATFAPETTNEGYLTARFRLGQLPRPDDQHLWVPARLVAGCGRRRLTLLAAPTAEPTAPVTLVEYNNLFGARDTFALLGSCTEEEKNTYVSARIGGQLRTLRATPEPHTKGQTGALMEGDIACLRDLALSPTATIKGEPVVITALDFKRDTAHHALPTAELQWSPAEIGRFQTVTSRGLFDLTFDPTFN